MCRMLRVVRMSLMVLMACSAARWCWSRIMLVKDLSQASHLCPLTRVFDCIEPSLPGRFCYGLAHTPTPYLRSLNSYANPEKIHSPKPRVARRTPVPSDKADTVHTEDANTSALAPGAEARRLFVKPLPSLKPEMAKATLIFVDRQTHSPPWVFSLYFSATRVPKQELVLMHSVML